MNRFELKDFRKKLNLTQTGFAKLFEKATMRTVQNWEGGATPVPEHVEFVIKRELEKINTPYFVNENTPLNIISEPTEKYDYLYSENLGLKKIIVEKDKLITAYEKVIDGLEEKVNCLEESLGQKKQNGTN